MKKICFLMLALFVVFIAGCKKEDSVDSGFVVSQERAEKEKEITFSIAFPDGEDGILKNKFDIEICTSAPSLPASLKEDVDLRFIELGYKKICTIESSEIEMVTYPSITIKKDVLEKALKDSGETLSSSFDGYNKLYGTIYCRVIPYSGFNSFFIKVNLEADDFVIDKNNINTYIEEPHYSDYWNGRSSSTLAVPIKTPWDFSRYQRTHKNMYYVHLREGFRARVGNKWYYPFNENKGGGVYILMSSYAFEDFPEVIKPVSAETADVVGVLTPYVTKGTIINGRSYVVSSSYPYNFGCLTVGWTTEMLGETWFSEGPQYDLSSKDFESITKGPGQAISWNRSSIDPRPFMTNNLATKYNENSVDTYFPNPYD